MKIQLVQILHKLPTTEKHTIKELKLHPTLNKLLSDSINGLFTSNCSVEIMDSENKRRTYQMESKSMEIGTRCRRFRSTLGWTQKDLADAIGTTPQNISKYEKEGIHDIDIIEALSAALGYDLTSDEMDREGQLGEIGKEILMLLATHSVSSANNLTDGMPFEDLNYSNGGYLFGLSEERTIKELFKLTEQGLCIREQYTDFYDRKHDNIFITAKGVIALKHSSDSIIFSINFEDVCTYEMLCEGYESYQAYIDGHPVEKIIRNLSLRNGFRANLLRYLQVACDYFNHPINSDYFLGKSAYLDIMYSMIMDVTREKADYLLKYDLDEEYEFDTLNEELFGGQNYSLMQILKNYGYQNEALSNLVPDELEDKENKLTRFQELLDEDDVLENEYLNAHSILAETFIRKLEEHNEIAPWEWYSRDEIEGFIRNNILNPQTEYEKGINEALTQIKELDEEILKKYFEFPYEWEENGLADLVRELYGVD